jgi:DNA-binding SARP family transcriptional activator
LSTAALCWYFDLDGGPRVAPQCGMRIRLLGEIAAHVDGAPVDLGHERQRCVLAALLVEPGRPVPVDVLLERAWGDRLPQHPRQALYSYVSRLRRSLALGGCTLPRRPSGYLVEIDPLDVDLHLFDDLVRRAGEPGRATGARSSCSTRRWTCGPVTRSPGWTRHG